MKEPLDKPPEGMNLSLMVCLEVQVSKVGGPPGHCVALSHWQVGVNGQVWI